MCDLLVLNLTTCPFFSHRKKRAARSCQLLILSSMSARRKGSVAARRRRPGPAPVRRAPGPGSAPPGKSLPPRVRQAGLMRRRRQVEDASLEIIREASALMRAPLNPTEAYSAYVAHEMSQAGEADQRLAKDLFNQVLLWMHQGWLTNDTELSDPAHPAQHLLTPPAATSSPPARGRGRVRGRSAAMQAARRVTRNRRR